MFRRLILPCLVVLVFCSQNQAFGSQTKTCDYKLEKYKIAIKQVNSKGKTNRYHAIVSFIIQYQHVDDDEIVVTSIPYSKEYPIAASSEREAKDWLNSLIDTFAREELEKQCKEKGCKTSK